MPAAVNYLAAVVVIISLGGGLNSQRTTARDLRAKGGELRLVATQPHIIKLLELTGLDEMFDVLPDTKAAVTR